MVKIISPYQQLERNDAGVVGVRPIMPCLHTLVVVNVCSVAEWQHFFALVFRDVTIEGGHTD